MQVLRLAAGELRAEVAPESGGSLSALWSEREGHRCDWLRPASREGLHRRDPLAMASFPLVPFCNRIRDGRASFEGREIHVRPNHPAQASPHPLHGIGWRRPWSVVSSGHDSADLALEVSADEAWPWRFSARQRYALDGRSLAVHLEVRNDDDAAMPLGLGHHPYFPHTPGTRLTLSAAAMWATDAEVMPVGLEMGAVVDQLRAGVALDQLVLDNNFVGWEHAARIDWPADARSPQRHLLLEAAPPLDYFVIYSPRGTGHFCAEPVSQCTDWLNLASRHDRDSLGGARLMPGERLGVSFRLTPGWGG